MSTFLKMQNLGRLAVIFFITATFFICHPYVLTYVKNKKYAYNICFLHTLTIVSYTFLVVDICQNIWEYAYFWWSTYVKTYGSMHTFGHRHMSKPMGACILLVVDICQNLWVTYEKSGSYKKDNCHTPKILHFLKS